MDSHCHLDTLMVNDGFRLDNFNFPVNYLGCICNFAFPRLHYTLRDILNHDGVYGAVSFHPKFSYLWNSCSRSHMVQMLSHPKVLAVGETGLDEKYLKDAPFEQQLQVFREHLELACRFSKTLVIHCRGLNFLDILLAECRDNLPKDFPIHVHCFTGTLSQAKEWIASFSNVMFGITNMVNKPNAYSTHSLASKLPLENLLLETDAPHFIPHGLYDKYRYANPGLALNVAQRLSELRSTSLQIILQQTTFNCKRVYQFYKLD